jgi:long-chain acyl-CoA synthetase
MKEDKISLTFPAMFEETLRKSGKKNAYAFVGEEPKSYEKVSKEINALIAFLEKNGICPGDRLHC